MKNVVKIFGIPMSSLGGVHLISGIAPYIAEMCILLNSILDEWLEFTFRPVLHYIHTLRVHYAHVAANLNSGYSKYAKVVRVHYFCTIALRTYRAVLTRASRRVDLRERRVDSFSKRVIIFCW